MEDILHHQSSQFDAELSRLRNDVLKMGGLVENQVSTSIEAYGGCDLGIAKDIVARDQDINALEKQIDDECTQVIARRQPTAVDLRLVFGIIKIVTDLERIGDESKKIAKGVRRICETGQSPSQFAPGIRHLAEAVLVMVRDSLDAFARLDSAQAKRVIEDDTNVDTEFKAAVRQLITHMMEDPRTISTAMDIIWIARAIERIGDHAKNVAEHVIFIAEGQDIRHLGRSKPEGTA
jgi:phosphate transport system protein